MKSLRGVLFREVTFLRVSNDIAVAVDEPPAVVTSAVFVDLEGGLARDGAILDCVLVFGLFEFDIEGHGAILAL